MMHPCGKPCGNKTANGYCATTACINPQYSNLGTAYYGQGVQRRIITNADRIRTMSDEELAETMLDCFVAFYEVEWSKKDILDWLKQEVEG